MGEGVRPVELVSVITSVMVSLADAWACSILLPMRSRGLYWAVTSVGLVIATLVRPGGFGIANLVGFLFFVAVLPCLFWKAPWTQRVICGVLVMTMQIALEMSLMGLLSVLGLPQLPLDVEAIAPEVVFAGRVANLAFIVAGGLVLRWLVRRTMRVEAELSASSYAAFFVAQTILAILPFYFVLACGAQGAAIYFGTFVIIVVCACAEGVAMISLARCASVERVRVHAALLEERLEGYLERSRELLRFSAEMAHLRHDQRNHLAVVRRLVSRGRLDEAAHYVRELREELERGER